MKRERCDILIAGAGPAGTSAAIAAAGKGVKVIVAERRGAVGIPIRCAEYIPKPLLGELKLPPTFVVQPVSGMRTFSANGSVKEIRAPGLIVSRARLDRMLAEAAVRAGVEIRLSTRVLGRQMETVFLKGPDGSVTAIEPRVVIGADGPCTTVGRWIGSENRNLMPAVQAQVPLAAAMEITEIYFDPEVFGGYCWLFPRGERANVGLGLKRRKGRKLNLKELLHRFIERMAREGKIEDRVLAYTAGWIPADRPRRVVSGNVLLAGDAAGHTHPITGAGVSQAVFCGRMAGDWAAEAVRKNDLDLLEKYEAQWRELFEDVLERAFQRRRMLEAEWDRLDEILPQCWVAFKEYYRG